jgi:lipopolysaccharide/colanic/teichoic acid biosynthesis glycosyltransferase
MASTNLIAIPNENRHALSLHPSASCWIKRSIDILGGLVGIGVLLLLFVPIAIAIKLDSRGPIFYTQERYGLHKRTFRILKFRSMVANADELKSLVQNEAQGHFFKNENDPRITRVGRFLRRTSLDEVPQFWNVLKGEMSLVGTRPPTPAEVAGYETHHWQRLNVKPGITGQWQANGRSTIKDFEEVVKLDLQYQALWSPMHDIWLITQTVLRLFTRPGAY